jgi:ubiquinone/menaquinone biosynthesis C-methylase UbiE
MLQATTSFIRPEEFWRSVDLRAGQTVVHLGCGAGFYLIPAAKMVGQTGKVIGIDIRSDMLAEAENRAERSQVAPIVQTVRANLETTRGSTLKDHLADITLVANILHQAEASKIFQEAQRITKKEGKIVVVEWETVATPLGPPAHARLSAAQVREVAKSVGLKEEKTFTPSPYHYGLIFSP